MKMSFIVSFLFNIILTLFLFCAMNARMLHYDEILNDIIGMKTKYIGGAQVCYNKKVYVTIQRLLFIISNTMTCWKLAIKFPLFLGKICKSPSGVISETRNPLSLTKYLGEIVA